MPSVAPPQVVVYGTVCLDRFLFDAEPAAAPRDLPGGEAFNTATALAGWGAAVALVGTSLGQDAEGDALRHLLDTHPLGLPRDFLPDNPDAVTPLCTVRVAADGERSMTGRGFRDALPPDPALLQPLLANRPVFTADPNLREAAEAAVLAAAEAGCPVVAMDFGETPAVVGASRIHITSQDWLRGGELPEVALRRWADAGARVGIVTLGPAGGIVLDRELGLFRYEAATPSAPVIDTTGAGDAFRAGLCFGLSRDWPLRTMIRFAAAAAALHCTYVGGGSRVPLDAVMSLAGGDLS